MSHGLIDSLTPKEDDERVDMVWDFTIEDVETQRRYKELCEKGQSVRYEDVLAEMNSRDNADSSREIAPTKAADDAVLLDNSDLSLEESVAAVIAIAKEKVGGEIRE